MILQIQLIEQKINEFPCFKQQGINQKRQGEASPGEVDSRLVKDW